MIYSFPNPEEPIRQGDIFYPLPFTVINLDEVIISQDEDRIETKSWDEISDSDKNVAILPIKNVWGIVASQDCDNSNSNNISLFIIKPFPDSVNTPPKSPHKWQEWITKTSRENAKWFYLPKDDVIGFPDKMLVQFQEVFQISRLGLEKRKSTHRKGRLNEVADEHFRESMAQFFRRYPYNEWYSLNNEELDAYNAKMKGTVKPYPWQEKD